MSVTCAICGKAKENDPHTAAGWRGVELNKIQYYICPDHFAPEGATREERRQAYIAAIKQIQEGSNS